MPVRLLLHRSLDIEGFESSNAYVGPTTQNLYYSVKQISTDATVRAGSHSSQGGQVVGGGGKLT